MKATKVKPALFNLGGNWHWVWLPELAEILELAPEQVISTYRDLVKEAYDGCGTWRVGELHWRDANGDCPYSTDSYCEPPNGQIYVPAGFSNDVLQVREWGVVRLKRVIHGSLMPLDGALREFYVKGDPEDPRNNRMAIVGLKDPFNDASAVWAPLGKKFPLLG